MKAVTFGEIMLRLKTPEYLRIVQSNSFEASYGGAEANVAVSLAMLGDQVSFVTKVPTGPVGQAAINEVRRFGVDTKEVVRGGERLGIYFFEKGTNIRPTNVVYDRKYSAMSQCDPSDVDWEKILGDAENISYSVYGTPMESTTYRFAKCLQRRFGIIKGVTDKNYITNSYHVHVTEEIDAFSKLKFESDFQKLSPGGAVSYVEVPNMQNNIPAVLSVMKFIYENIMYAELNTKSDYCEACGYDGEIKIVEDESGKLVWECPNCGNRDQNRLSVARRTCGYIGTQFWNQGRTQEIRDRVLHVSSHTFSQD